MAKKADIFSKDIESLLNACGDLFHLASIERSRIKRENESLDRAYEAFKTLGREDLFFSGTCLPIIDVFHEGEWVTRSPSVRRETMATEIKQLANELYRRSNAYILVSLHERLEEFLRDAYGKFRFQVRNEKSLSDKQAFHKSRQGQGGQRGTAEYFQRYAKWKCRNNCDPIMVDYQRLLPWERFKLHVDFREFAHTIGMCRHWTVHNGGIVTPEGLGKLKSDGARKFVSDCVEKQVHGDRQLFLPDHETARHSIELIASYAYGLYVLLTDHCRMKSEYQLGRQR